MRAVPRFDELFDLIDNIFELVRKYTDVATSHYISKMTSGNINSETLQDLNLTSSVTRGGRQ